MPSVNRTCARGSRSSFGQTEAKETQRNNSTLIINSGVRTICSELNQHFHANGMGEWVEENAEKDNAFERAGASEQTSAFRWAA